MICEKEEEAISHFNATIVQKLRARLSDLHAAETVKDLFVGNPCEITYQNQDAYKIDLSDGYQIIFISNHIMPISDTNKTNWGKISRIKLIQIKNNE